MTMCAIFSYFALSGWNKRGNSYFSLYAIYEENSNLRYFSYASLKFDDWRMESIELVDLYPNLLLL